MYGTRSATRKVPATDPSSGRRFDDAALLICSHGSPSQGSGEAGRAVRARAGSLRPVSGFAETAGCLLHGDPELEDAVADLAAETVYLVPLFMSQGVTLAALAERIASLGDAGRVVLCRPVGSHPDLPRRLVRAAEAQAQRRGWSARETAVVMVGHGSWRSGASRGSTERMAKAVAEDGRFAEVAVALLENGPPLEAVMAALRSDRAVVIGCFSENGRHALQDQPDLLSGTGRRSAYLGPIGAAPWFGQLVLDLAVEQATADASGHQAREVRP